MTLSHKNLERYELLSFAHFDTTAATPMLLCVSFFLICVLVAPILHGRGIQP